jgi:hypothetical protein
MTTQTANPRFDAIDQHPDDAETAYAYFPPTEESGARSSMPDDFEEVAQRPLSVRA